jgi:hypothetical protein
MKIDLSTPIRIVQSLCPTGKAGTLTAGLVALVVKDGRAYVESSSLEAHARIEVPVEDAFDCSLHLMPAPFRNGPVAIKAINESGDRLMVVGEGMRSSISTIPAIGSAEVDAILAESGWASIPHGSLESLADSIRWVAVAAGNGGMSMDAVLFRNQDILSSDGKSLHWASGFDVGSFTCPSKAATSIADALDAADTDAEIKIENNKIAIKSGNLFFSTYGTTEFKDIVKMCQVIIAGSGASYTIKTTDFVDAIRKCQHINPGYAKMGIDAESGGVAIITENKGSESIIAMDILSGTAPESGKICAFDPSKMLSALQPFTKGNVILMADPDRSGSGLVNIRSEDASNTHKAALAQMAWR